MDTSQPVCRKGAEVASALEAEPPCGAEASDEKSWAWPSSVSGCELSPRAPAPADDERLLREEEERVRRATRELWENCEVFNLNHAFGLQLARVDAEWGMYEEQLRRELEAKLDQFEFFKNYARAFFFVLAKSEVSVSQSTRGATRVARENASAPRERERERKRRRVAGTTARAWSPLRRRRRCRGRSSRSGS